MKFFPIFVNVDKQKIVVAGAGETAVAKIRLLLKTDAYIHVFGKTTHEVIKQWALAGKIIHHSSKISAEDISNARLFYIALEQSKPEKIQELKQLAAQSGVYTNVVDHLKESDFITPALVDRDPLTIAIGTEGTAPVLARRVKSQLESMLSADLGKYARLAEKLRSRLNHLLEKRLHRAFWQRFYPLENSLSFSMANQDSDINTKAKKIIHQLNEDQHDSGFVSFVGAGPGDPELLTLKARKRLDTADVIIHDRLITNSILDLIRREAIQIEAGKKGFGPSMDQQSINELMIRHAKRGLHVVRLKSGDSGIYGRIDEEMDALDQASIEFEIIPGITSSIAAAAQIKASLTKRGRNSSFQILTGHDINGFADHDWKQLAKSGSVATIYMGYSAIKYLSGRLLMFGADPQTPLTLIENASRENEKILTTTIAQAPTLANEKTLTHGPVMIILGIVPRYQTNLNSNLEKKRLAQ